MTEGGGGRSRGRVRGVRAEGGAWRGLGSLLGKVTTLGPSGGQWWSVVSGGVEREIHTGFNMIAVAIVFSLRGGLARDAPRE